MTPPLQHADWLMVLERGLNLFEIIVPVALVLGVLWGAAAVWKKWRNL